MGSPGLKVNASVCQNAVLLKTRTNEKNFQTETPYCISAVDKYSITVNNDAGKQMKLFRSSWMDKWMLDGEKKLSIKAMPRDDSTGCAADLIFTCIKNLEKGAGKAPENVAYLPKENLEALLPSTCLKNQPGSPRGPKVALRQVSGFVHCGEFNVFDVTHSFVVSLDETTHGVGPARAKVSDRELIDGLSWAF